MNDRRGQALRPVQRGRDLDLLLRDSGLLHTLLKITTLDDLQGHPVLGSSWEGFVVEQICSMLPQGWEPYFYRSSAGAEIDLIVLGSSKHPLAIEIKYSAAPKVSAGFWNAFEDMKCDRGVVVYPGTQSYPIARKVTAFPVSKIESIFD